MEHIPPGIVSTTTMAYDMVTEHDNNISTEIKSILMGNLGWHENIPQITIKQTGMRDTIEYGVDMPASTLWKVNIARGKAFAIKDTLYDAVEIR